MEILIVLAVLAIGGYVFIKGVVARGAETVRASLFLTRIRAGSTVAEADLVAGIDVTNLPPFFAHRAAEDVRLSYEGKQLSMIAKAYRAGMTPRLPWWNQALINMRVAGEEAAAMPNNGARATRNVSGTYEQYLHTVVTEVKRLDGKSQNELHWFELTEDDGTRRAYADGVDPLLLAAGILKYGPPSPWNVG